MSIAVIIPFVSKKYTYNFPEKSLLLRQTLNSIKNSDYSGLQTLVISNDRPECDLESARFIKTDIHVIKRERAGSYQVDKEYKLFFGLRAALELKVELVYRLDADDLVHRRLFHAADASKAFDLQVLQKGYLYFAEEGIIRYTPNFASACGSSLFFRSDCVLLPTDWSELTRWSHPELVRHFWPLRSHIQDVQRLATDRSLSRTTIPFRGGMYRLWRDSLSNNVAGYQGRRSRILNRILGRRLNEKVADDFGIDLDLERKIIQKCALA